MSGKISMRKEDIGVMVKVRKAVMVGCGFVGATSVFALMQSGIFSEIAMIDADFGRAEGEAMDISHGVPYSESMDIHAGNYDDVKDASVVIISAGANQKPGETRLDLVQKNVAIMKQIIPEIMSRGFDGILLIVSNPVDVMTYVAQKLSGLPENKVIGSGTVLDTARLKYELSEFFDVNSKNVHAFIVGEHGDSEIAVWSTANIAGVPVQQFSQMRGEILDEEKMTEIADKIKNSAYEIIQRKKATYYGVAVAVRKICEVIVRDEKMILTVSTALHGEEGLEDVVLGMPCILGKDGIEAKVPLSLSEKEREKLQKSAETLKGVLQSIQW